MNVYINGGPYFCAQDLQLDTCTTIYPRGPIANRTCTNYCKSVGLQCVGSFPCFWCYKGQQEASKEAACDGPAEWACNVSVSQSWDARTAFLANKLVTWRK